MRWRSSLMTVTLLLSHACSDESHARVSEPGAQSQQPAGAAAHPGGGQTSAPNKDASTRTLARDHDAARPLESDRSTKQPDKLDAGASHRAEPGVAPPMDAAMPAVNDTLAAVDASLSMGMTQMTPLFPLMPTRPDCVIDDDFDAGAADAADEDAGTPHCVPPPPDCAGKPGAPGNTTRMYNGRSYIVHIPSVAPPDKPLPVMLVFHGSGGTGAQMQAATGFDALADQVGIVTIYPDGQAGNAPWNVGRNVCPPGNFVSTTQDDITYVEHILSDVEADQCLDKRRVYATGFSMGAYFSNELGCRIGRSVIRAIAPHSGGTHAGNCPGAPLPVLLLHGDSDSLINYACGTSARDQWLRRNGCSDQSSRVDITGGYCDFYKGCPADGPVVMCTFNGLDHGWAYPPMYENAGLLIWLFFSGLW